MRKHLLINTLLLMISLLSLAAQLNPTNPRASSIHTVCASGCNFQAIQEAINEVQANDTIQLLDPVHLETGIFVSKTLIIEGMGAGLTNLKAAPSPGTAYDRLFFVDSPVTLTIKDMTISSGRAMNSSGGGIWNEGSLNLSGVIMKGNAAGVHGGALYTTGPTAIISSTITNNQAGTFAGGGGVAVENSSLILENSAIDHNTAGYGGGILFSEGTQLTIYNSTISTNESIGSDLQYSGGGALNIYALKSNPQVKIQFSTLAGNSSTVSGRDGVWVEKGTLSFLATILDHSSGNCHSTDGAIDSDGFNIESEDSCGFNEATDLIDKDPKLLPLSANGGPSPTHGLNNGSPALDLIPPAKCAPLIDQRGISRPIGGGCEVGSFEANPPTAAFLASPTAGDGPLSVIFTNHSSGEYVTCEWDYGDGDFSSTCNMSPHIYDRPGIFTVRLTISGPSGSDTYTRANYIKVGRLTFLPLIGR